MKAKTTIKTETVSAKITKETKGKLVKKAKMQDRTIGYIVAKIIETACA